MDNRRDSVLGIISNKRYLIAFKPLSSTLYKGIRACYNDKNCLLSHRAL